jgi:hypothetical protein
MRRCRGLLQPRADRAWVLDAYLPLGAFSALQEELNRHDVDETADDAPGREQVLLRVVDEPWPFPPHYQLAAEPLSRWPRSTCSTIHTRPPAASGAACSRR